MKVKVASKLNKCSNERFDVTIPASKSLSHRALISAALADGRSIIRNLAENDDTAATIECLKQLGATITRESDRIIVDGIGTSDSYQGDVVDCHESGSTLRFLIPIFANTAKVCKFTGRGRLMERPQTVYESLFETFYLEDNVLNVQGRLAGGSYEIAGNISSQFITGLLFTLPMADCDSVINVLPPFESASYVDLTIDILEKAGIEIERDGLQIRIPGKQKYRPFEYTVTGDFSQAAFYAAEALIGNKEIAVHGLAHDSHQGDRIVIDFVRQFGGMACEIEDGYLFAGGELSAIDVDLGDCPDLGPAMFALASQVDGTTRFHNVERLRIKESDRIATMQEELAKIGCEVTVGEDVLAPGSGDVVFVPGKMDIKEPVTFNGHNDHRIVMALSVLAAAGGERFAIEGAEAIKKSYPGFFEDLEKTGIEVTQE